MGRAHLKLRCSISYRRISQSVGNIADYAEFSAVFNDGARPLCDGRPGYWTWGGRRGKRRLRYITRENTGRLGTLSRYFNSEFMAAVDSLISYLPAATPRRPGTGIRASLRARNFREIPESPHILTSQAPSSCVRIPLGLECYGRRARRSCGSITHARPRPLRPGPTLMGALFCYVSVVLGIPYSLGWPEPTSNDWRVSSRCTSGVRAMRIRGGPIFGVISSSVAAVAISGRPVDMRRNVSECTSESAGSRRRAAAKPLHPAPKSNRRFEGSESLPP